MLMLERKFGLHTARNCVRARGTQRVFPIIAYVEYVAGLRLALYSHSHRIWCVHTGENN